MSTTTVSPTIAMIAAQMQENTGRSILDSGDAPTRPWPGGDSAAERSRHGSTAQGATVAPCSRKGRTMGISTAENGLQTCGTCGNSGYSFEGNDGYHHFPTAHTCQVQWEFMSAQYGLLILDREGPAEVPKAFVGAGEVYISGYWGPSAIFANVPAWRVAFLTPEQADVVRSREGATVASSRRQS